jgi:hypothetical protein
MQALEVKIDGGWGRVSIEDAWRYIGGQLRCISCRGSVYVMNDYSGKRPKRITHRPKWAECSGDENTPSPRNPKAVE